MANNRMWLVCPICNEALMLGKNLASGWYSAPSEEKMMSFYSKHEDCGVLEEPFKFVTEDMKGWDYNGKTDEGITKIIFHNSNES